MALDISRLPILPPPYEIYEFTPGKPAYFKITGYRVGKITIKPRWAGAPPVKEVVALRLYAAPEAKKYYPPYWDITPARLVYQLAGMLAHGFPKDMWLKITRDIPGPKAHFGVEWVERPGL